MSDWLTGHNFQLSYPKQTSLTDPFILSCLAQIWSQSPFQPTVSGSHHQLIRYKLWEETSVIPTPDDLKVLHAVQTPYSHRATAHVPTTLSL